MENREFLRVRGQISGAARHAEEEARLAELLLAKSKPLGEELRQARREELEGEPVAYI